MLWRSHLLFRWAVEAATATCENQTIPAES